MRYLPCSLRSSCPLSLPVVDYFVKRFVSTDPRNKQPFIRDKVHVNVCSLGHSGHGKSSLSSAITFLQSKLNCATFKPPDEIDKSPDERAKGQSILPCKMEFTTKSKHFILTDLPGSQNYIKNTIFGACGSDVGLIVVNCDEGPTEMTRQHLTIARHSGIKQLIGFINQFDDQFNDHESLEICQLATQEMLTEEGFDGNSVNFISGSTIKALNNQPESLASIEKLISVLDSLSNPERDVNSSGLFYIDKIYSPQGRGTGVTGTVKRGKFNKGQIIDCIGFNRLVKTKINYIECFNKVLEEAYDGDSIEIVLQGVKKDDIIRGMTICPADQYKQQNNIQVMLQLVNPVKPLITTSFVNVHFETGDILGQIILPKEKDFLAPNSTSLVEIKLSRSCVLEKGQSLLIREGNQVIGLGKVNQLMEPLSNEELAKMTKGRSRKNKEHYQSIVEKVESELNQQSI